MGNQLATDCRAAEANGAAPGSPSEYAYDKDPLLGSGTEQVLAAAASGGWTVIEMTTDWSTIYSSS